MGLLGVDSNSAKNTQTSAGDQARVLSGKHSRYTESGSFQVGDKSTYTESGGINISGKGASLKTGADLSGSTVLGTVTIGETGLGALFASTVKDLFGMTQAIHGDQSSTLPNPVDDLAPADAPVETTLLEKIKAHAGLIVLGLVVAFFAWKTFRK